MEDDKYDSDSMLCFVLKVGEESDKLNRYEFVFTDNIDEVWGDGFDHKPACLVNDLIPNDEYITEIHVVKTKLKFDLIQDNCCFSVSDAYDGICAIAYENLDEYEEYPEDGRLFFMFGETLSDVSRKLAMKGIVMV